jgi:hypothetical protein
VQLQREVLAQEPRQLIVNDQVIPPGL